MVVVDLGSMAVSWVGSPTERIPPITFFPLVSGAPDLAVCAVVSRDDKTLRDLLLSSISTFTWVFW